MQDSVFPKTGRACLSKTSFKKRWPRLLSFGQIPNGTQTRAPPWKRALLFLPCNRGRFHTGLLVPPVKTREVSRVPRLTESGFIQIPVCADFARHGAQVVPKIDDRWTPPEPVAVVDAVNHEARLEDERMRDHRIVLWV